MQVIGPISTSQTLALGEIAVGQSAFQGNAIAAIFHLIDPNGQRLGLALRA